MRYTPGICLLMLFHTEYQQLNLFETCLAGNQVVCFPYLLVLGLTLMAFAIDSGSALGECLAYTLLGLGYLNGGPFVVGGFNRRSIRPIVLIRSMLSLESVRFS
jgi:hypothetical protein